MNLFIFHISNIAKSKGEEQLGFGFLFSFFFPCSTEEVFLLTLHVFSFRRIVLLWGSLLRSPDGVVTKFVFH